MAIIHETHKRGLVSTELVKGEIPDNYHPFSHRLLNSFFITISLSPKVLPY